tara:strand:- start:46 stop:264 length:219 start_codon:yes stop_codon:yes gene_type:complete
MPITSKQAAADRAYAEQASPVQILVMIAALRGIAGSDALEDFAGDDDLADASVSPLISDCRNIITRIDNGSH